MTRTGTEDPAVVDPYFSDARLAGLIGPGGPYEVSDVVLDGVPLRTFVRAPRTIMDMFRAGQAHADLVHLVFEDERWTFAEVRSRALGTAVHLRDRYGVTRGDRVALTMRNYPEFFVGFWAAAALGAIVVPLNSWGTGPELAFALADAGAKVVFADQERVERLAGSGVEESATAVVAVRTDRAVHGDVVHMADLAGGPELPESEFAELGPDDPITILYTSGTTGRPKGALATNRAHITNIMNMGFMAARDLMLTGRTPPPPRQPVTISAAPLFHIGGVATTISGPMAGTRVVLMRRWDVDKALELAAREGVTTFGGVPAMAREILDHPRLADYGLDISGFPMGGASVPPDLPRRAVETFGPGIQILNGYGLTETTSGVVINIGTEYAQRPDSVGRPNLTADVRVLGSDGAPVGPGRIGELCFRSPQVARCYWNNPEATRESFVEGWFHSGDLGYVEDGFVYVVDRLKDVVIRGGENVYSAEVEAVLMEHPGLADAAVIGLPDVAMGELVCAVVVTRPGPQVRLADLRALVAGRLAAFKVPEALLVVAEIPRTATGKTAKNELRTALAAAEDRIERV